jgi:hypothetical protein
MNPKVKRLIELLEEGWSPDLASRKAGISHQEWRRADNPELRAIKEKRTHERNKNRPRWYPK